MALHARARALECRISRASPSELRAAAKGQRLGAESDVVISNERCVAKHVSVRAGGCEASDTVGPTSWCLSAPVFRPGAGAHFTMRAGTCDALYDALLLEALALPTTFSESLATSLF